MRWKNSGYHSEGKRVLSVTKGVSSDASCLDSPSSCSKQGSPNDGCCSSPVTQTQLPGLILNSRGFEPAGATRFLTTRPTAFPIQTCHDIRVAARESAVVRCRSSPALCDHLTADPGTLNIPRKWRNSDPLITSSQACMYPNQIR